MLENLWAIYYLFWFFVLIVWGAYMIITNRLRDIDDKEKGLGDGHLFSFTFVIPVEEEKVSNVILDPDFKIELPSGDNKSGYGEYSPEMMRDAFKRIGESK